MTDPAVTRPAPSLTARQPRAVHSALTVLEAVARLGAGATAREISAELGLPRATAYRLLNLLVQDEYLVRTPDLAGFALGAKVVQLVGAAVPGARLTTAARTVLAEARAVIRGGVHVVLYEDRRVVVVDADPDFPLSDGPGLLRDPARYALGRLLLAERGTVSEAVARDIRTLGAARQIGEIVPGFGCLALPLRDGAGVLAGAIGFSGAQHRVAEPEAVLAALRPVAERLGPLVA